MNLPSIDPPMRILIRTRPVQLQKIHPASDLAADAELIKNPCDKLSITDETNIAHLITRISDDKKLDNNKLERVDIIFDYGSIERQPPVMVYSVTVEGPNLVVKQLSNLYIRKLAFTITSWIHVLEISRHLLSSPI